MPRDVVIRSEADLEAFRARLADLRPALLVMGELLAAQGRNAFTVQALEEITWLRRYPNQREPPFVNVAGLLADLNAAREPPARRFQNAPVGVDTGGLLSSIAVHEVTEGGTLVVGSTAANAETFQKGGFRSQPVLSGAKIELARLIEQRPELGPRLSKLLTLEELVTRVAARPFMGITDTNRADFVEVLEAYLAGDDTDA